MSTSMQIFKTTTKTVNFLINLRQKIQQIQMNGGKQKLDMEVKILRNNSDQASAKFK